MPRSTATISTIKVDEHVRIDLRNRRSGVFAYLGVVTDVDGHAVRLRDAFRMASFGNELPHSTRADGDVILPWGAIQSVRLLKEATG